MCDFSVARAVDRIAALRAMLLRVPMMALQFARTNSTASQTA